MAIQFPNIYVNAFNLYPFRTIYTEVLLHVYRQNKLPTVKASFGINIYILSSAYGDLL